MKTYAVQDQDHRVAPLDRLTMPYDNSSPSLARNRCNLVETGGRPIRYTLTAVWSEFQRLG